MKTSFFLITLLFLFIAPLDAVYADGTPQIISRADRNERIEYAKKLKIFFDDIDKGIPNLSPSQYKWLENEINEYNKTNNIRRFLEVTNTKEFILDSSKKSISRIRLILTIIILTKDIKVELYNWIEITSVFIMQNFSNEIYAIVKEYNLIDKKLFFTNESWTRADREQFYQNNFVIPAWQIINNIIKPSFE